MKPSHDIYPSRTGGEETIVERQDPVVYGEPRPAAQHALSASQLRSYDDNGFLVLPDYMTDMAAELLAEIEPLKQRMAGREEIYTEPDSDRVRTIFKPHAFSDLVDRFSRDARILDAVRQILGSEVYITQSRINVKPAYVGKSFPWHSDFETWHVEDGMPRMRALTAWIMLTENNEHNGPLYVVPGSHRQYVSCAGSTGDRNYATSLKKQETGVPRPETMESLLAQRGITGVYGKPGTVVFHECNIMHGSPDNISHLPRTVLMCVYNSCENELIEPFCGLPPRPDYLRNPDPSPISAR